MHSSTYYVLHCQYIMCMLKYLQLSYIYNCMYVYSPLAICIQTTSEGGLAQFTFIVNQFNAESYYVYGMWDDKCDWT